MQNKTELEWFKQLPSDEAIIARQIFLSKNIPSAQYGSLIEALQSLDIFNWITESIAEVFGKTSPYMNDQPQAESPEETFLCDSHCECRNNEQCDEEEEESCEEEEEDDEKSRLEENEQFVFLPNNTFFLKEDVTGISEHSTNPDYFYIFLKNNDMEVRCSDRKDCEKIRKELCDIMKNY
jgi:hypothetical protein